LAQGALLGGLLLLGRLGVGRPLAESEAGARLLSRGELQRPLLIASTATAELHELQLSFEELRRSLLSRLRSSTELNLQLEAEVARRSAELGRRNDQLSEALSELRATQDDLLRSEKLAAVGEIAANVTSAICEPVSNLAAVAASLSGELDQLEQQLAHSPAGAGLGGGEAALAARLGALDAQLAALSADAQRVRDIVRALRLYARPQQLTGGAVTSAATASVAAQSDSELEAILLLVGNPPLGALKDAG
jgi:C4-dicarboxylate-specific signal transduction histidine kinase